tara:strand:+ start:888 stop:2045 length:1158 start_codon:yes stop_codon:yes gene_type:complete
MGIRGCYKNKWICHTNPLADNPEIYLDESGNTTSSKGKWIKSESCGWKPSGSWSKSEGWKNEGHYGCGEGPGKIIGSFSMYQRIPFNQWPRKVYESNTQFDEYWCDGITPTIFIEGQTTTKYTECRNCSKWIASDYCMEPLSGWPEDLARQHIADKFEDSEDSLHDNSGTSYIDGQTHYHVEDGGDDPREVFAYYIEEEVTAETVTILSLGGGNSTSIDWFKLKIPYYTNIDPEDGTLPISMEMGPLLKYGEDKEILNIPYITPSPIEEYEADGYSGINMDTWHLGPTFYSAPFNGGTHEGPLLLSTPELGRVAWAYWSNSYKDALTNTEIISSREDWVVSPWVDVKKEAREQWINDNCKDQQGDFLAQFQSPRPDCDSCDDETA